MRIFDKLLCKHEWKEEYRQRQFEDDDSKRPYAVRIVLVCEKCGKIQKVEL